MTRIIPPPGYATVEQIAEESGTDMVLDSLRRKLSKNGVPHLPIEGKGNRKCFVFEREEALRVARLPRRSPGPQKGYLELRGDECGRCGCRVSVSDGVCKFCRQQDSNGDYLSLRWENETI